MLFMMRCFLIAKTHNFRRQQNLPLANANAYNKICLWPNILIIFLLQRTIIIFIIIYSTLIVQQLQQVNMMEAFKYFGSIVVAALAGASLQSKALYQTQKNINPNLDDHLINLSGLVNSIDLARKKDKEDNNKLIADLQGKIEDLKIQVNSCYKQIQINKKQKDKDMQKIQQLEKKIIQLSKSCIFIQQAKWMKDCQQSQANLHGSYTWSRHTKGSYTGNSNIHQNYRGDFQKFQKHLKSLDGYQQRTFKVSNLLLGDACKGHDKKLKIKYSCRKNNGKFIIKQKFCQVKENSNIFLSCLD